MKKQALLLIMIITIGLGVYFYFKKKKPVISKKRYKSSISKLIDSHNGVVNTDSTVTRPLLKTHKIVKGDDFALIAAKNRVDIFVLMRANPHIADINNLNVGGIINIPS